VSLRDGRFEIVAASAGSLEVVFDAVGLLAMVLLSNPVQLLLTADALLGHLRSARVWMRRRSDPLTGISARDAVTVLRAFGAAGWRALGDPDAEVVPRRRESVAEPLTPTVDPNISDLTSIGGVAGARRITHLRISPDGTVDVIVIE
jgi:hypothetical protein